MSDREEEVSESLAPPAANEPQGETTATTTNTTTDRHAVLSMDADTQNQLALDWTQLAAQAPPVRYPADVTDIDPEETELLIVGTAGQKITNMGKDLCQHVSSDLTSLVLRSHLIKHMEGLEGFSKLETLELYDNQVQELQCLGDGPNGAPGQTLLVLDISYNAIRDLQPIEACPHLRELCKSIVQRVYMNDVVGPESA
jgi:Leucine-rich repeat (LRR) protein